MIDKKRRAAARKFRQILNQGILRKNAFVQVLQEFGVSRRSVYRYCAEFGISTR